MISSKRGKSRDNYILPFCWFNFSDDMVYYGRESPECFVSIFIGFDKLHTHFSSLHISYIESV
jgi:hypothetical protein